MIITAAQIEVFLLIFARIIGIFIAAPLFSTRTFPATTKVAFAIWLAAVLWYVTPFKLGSLPTSLTGLVMALTFEVLIGYLLGFVCNIIFLAIQAAGEMIDMQMGLSVANSFDPIFGATISVVGRFMITTALTIFVLADGHHLVLSALHQSFRAIPPAHLPNISSPMLTQQLMELGKTFWTIALQLAGPIILIIFLSDFAFGIVSRVAPQVNVFMLGFQVKPALGLVGVLFTLPLLVKHMANLLGVMSEEMLKLLMAIK